jgi:cell wall-associated NlpC family hydrolase
VKGLTVLDHRVHATPGASIKLEDWGVLDILPAQKSTAAAAVTESITGLRLTLVRAHAGLQAGTVVDVATAQATLTPATAPAASGNGAGGDTGGSTPSGSGTGQGGTAGAGQGGDNNTPAPPPAGAKPPSHPRHHHRAAPSRSHPAAPPRAHPRQPAEVSAPQATHALIAAAAGGRARVLKAALEQVGWPYIWGGDSRSEGGFDCSGLVDYAYARAGMALPGRPTAAVLWRMSMAVGRGHLQPGDLAFLYTSRRTPYHVALYAGHGLVVVAPHSGAKVQIEPLASVAWDGYGRLLAGGRGDGLARSVAAAARRFALTGAIHRRLVAAARAADARAAKRVQVAAGEYDLRRLQLHTRTAPVPAVAEAHIVPLANVVHSPVANAGRVLGVALLVILAAVFAAGMPSPLRRAAGD